MTEKEKKRREKLLRKKIQKFRLLDDEFMSKVFEDDIDLTQFMLNIIMQRKDLAVLEAKGQVQIKNLQGRSVRLDIKATDKDGKRTYRSTPKDCKNCPCRGLCGANEKGQKIHTTHIWQEYLDLVEGLRKTERGRQIYAMRKETIERVFADAKEKHAMRYTHHRGLARVTGWVKLKYAAMNLKKLANWSWKNSFFSRKLLLYLQNVLLFCNYPAKTADSFA